MGAAVPHRGRVLTAAFELPTADPGWHLLTENTVRVFRFDAEPFCSWSWASFPTPRYRFDSPTGSYRVRYAATTALGAARERYRDTGMYVPADHAGHHVAVLSGRIAVLDLRREDVLDALHVDDRISTGRAPDVWAACQRLTDRVHGWWGDNIHAVVYRPRTTPGTSTNVAFFAAAPLHGTSMPLQGQADVLDELVIGGFGIGFAHD